MKCLECGEEVVRSKFHFHIKKHYMKLEEYYIKFDFDFTNKEYLENEYYINKKSLKRITKECEGKYLISNLKPMVLYFAKYFEIQKRDASLAGKIYFENNKVWNKGQTKETNPSVMVYANKKKELYKKVKEKLESLSIQDLLKYNVQQNKKIRNILRKKLIKKENYICPICGCGLVDLSNRLVHIHHIDRDNSNDAESNLIVLCAGCHMKLSGHKHRLKKIDFIQNYEMFMGNLDLIKNEFSKIKKNKPNDYSYRNTEYGICEICGEEENIHIHHLDINSNNNNKNNLVFLCRKCHGKVTGYNIKANSKKDMINQLGTVDKFNKKLYCKNSKENGRCSINISKLKLTEFIQS